MNDIKKVKLVHETPDHFIMHDGKTHFHVAKKGLDENMVKKIQSFAEGGQLDANARAHIAPKNFALPGGRYPIEDENHARNALARVSQHGSPEEKARVRAAVYKKYPHIEQQHLDSGGDVDPNLSNLGNQLYKAFEHKSKPVSMPPQESVEDRNERIRAENRKFMGYAYGGVVSQDEKVTSKKEESDFNKKQLNDAIEEAQHIYGKSENNYAEGGSVIDPDKAKQIQDSFRGATHYTEGGQIAFDQDFADKFKKGSGFSSGGEIPGMPGHNIDPREMEEEAKHLNTPEEYPKEWHNKLGSMDNFQEKPVQHFDVGGTAGGLPPDFDNRVEQEKQNLAINQTAMPPEVIDNNNILPMTTQPLNTNQFQTQAETNIAAQDQDQLMRAAQSEEAQKALTAQAVQDQNSKIMADNQVRMQAGLPQIPMTPAPSMGSSQQPQMVSKENQISFASQQPQTSSSSQMPQKSLVGGFDKSLRQIESGINENAKLQAQGMAENAKLIQANIEEQKQRAADYEKERAGIQEQNMELFNQVRDSKIDPNRIWTNSNTGQKIAASLGLIFGGIGAGMTHQPNLAAQFLEKTIDQDIEAQKADQSNKMNLYKLGLEKYKDTQSAQQFATLQASNILAGQIQATAQRIGSPQALALAKQAIGELHMKYDPVRNDLALKQVALNYGQQGQLGQQSSVPASGINTGKMSAFMNAGLYDEPTKKELVKEQGEYIKAKNFMDLTDNLFNEQSKNANYTNRIPGAKHLPTFRESTKQYDAAVNVYLDKMTKDLTGRVTPQSMENLHSSMPVAGDSPETLLAKRNAMKDIIKTAYDFPTLTNKGLLNPNDPILQSSANSKMKFQQGAPVLKK